MRWLHAHRPASGAPTQSHIHPTISPDPWRAGMVQRMPPAPHQEGHDIGVAARAQQRNLANKRLLGLVARLARHLGVHRQWCLQGKECTVGAPCPCHAMRRPTRCLTDSTLMATGCAPCRSALYTCSKCRCSCVAAVKAAAVRSARPPSVHCMCRPAASPPWHASAQHQAQHSPCRSRRCPAPSHCHPAACRSQSLLKQRATVGVNRRRHPPAAQPNS